MLWSVAIKCVGVLPDLHIPFHNRRALAAALNCLADSKLDALFLLGDVVDAYNLSMHGPKHPAVHSSLLDEVNETKHFLDTVDLTWPELEKHFVEGNHEWRLERYICANAPALFGITDMQMLLGMHNRPGWKWHPYGARQLVQVLNSNLYTCHAPKGSSGRSILNAAGCNLMFGHVHRIIDEHNVTKDGRSMQIFSPGWLGEMRNDQVFGYVQGHHTWKLGFARLWIDDETGEFWTEINESKDDGHSFVVGGKRYKA